MTAPLTALPTIEDLDAEIARRRALRDRYWAAPALWAEECIRWRPGEGLTPYQHDTLAALVQHHRAAVRSLHGAGKTMTAALATLWFAVTRDGLDWKAPTTAGGWRQLAKYLWPEIHKWARRIRWDVVGRPQFDPRTELLDLSLKLSTGEAFALASDDPALIEGAHADHLLFVFDESKNISAELFDAAEGAFMGATGTEAFALAISTPGDPSGRFYDIHRRAPGYEDWWTRHVTLAEALAAGRMTQEKADQRKRQWGESSAVYQNRILGEFAASEEGAVCPLAWVEAAIERWRDWQDSGERLGAAQVVGTDVARSGMAETVHALRAGNTITDLRAYQGQDTMETAGQVAGILAANPGCLAVIDVVGLGAGPVDRLREQGAAVLAFSAGAKTDAKDATGEQGFVNLRSAAWWHLRELLDPGSRVAPPVRLPPDDMLIGDLTAPKWRTTSFGKIEVESKDSIAKRIGRSTDRGDAVMQAFAADLFGFGAPPSHEDDGEMDWGLLSEDEVAGTFL